MLTMLGVWKRTRNLSEERIALHLARLQLVPTENIPGGIDVAAPLAEDMLAMLRVYAPGVLARALPVLKEEGILTEAEANTYEVGEYSVPAVLSNSTSAAEDDAGGNAEILVEGKHHVVVRKPPSVVTNNPGWSKRKRDPRHLPMLQRVGNQTGRRVNLVHHLDRSASGCLLMTFAETREGEHGDRSPCRVMTCLKAMQDQAATKTYIALCDGDGVWNGVNYLKRGWFTFDQPAKDKCGELVEDAQTDICFVAATALPPVTYAGAHSSLPTSKNCDGCREGCKVSIVMVRPHKERWHQIRQHMASSDIGHAILGDSSHGRSRTNRHWKRKRHLAQERTCLHLSRLQLPATEYTPEGIDITCPLPSDLAKMIKYFPEKLLEEARPILAKEGIHI